MNRVIVSLKNIGKSFGITRALDDVCLDIREGEIHAILGQNGAGKSTLVKILDNVHKEFEGEVLYRGQVVPHKNMHEFFRKKLGVVHQEFPLVPYLSVAENIYLSDMPRSKITGNILWNDLFKQAQQLLSELKLNVDVRTKVKDLSAGERQLISIARALAKKPELLVLDEATSTLTDSEVEILFSILKDLISKKIGIIYISHRIEEIFSMANRVTVLRDGKSVFTSEVKITNRTELISMMAGRDVDKQFPDRPKINGEEILRVENLTGEEFKNCSFTVRSGEILGVAGLVGSGRPELMKAVFGAEKKTQGQIIKRGRKLNIKRPLDAIKEGIYFIPSDRRKEGIFKDLSIRDNLTIALLRSYTKLGWINHKKESRVTNEYIGKLKIKTTGESQKISNLSGGNQQKVIIGRWLSGNGEVFLFDEPTRGLDVGVKYDVYELMNQIKSSNGAVVMVSSELPELLAMSDRIIVMYEGEIVAEMENDNLTQETVLKAMMNQKMGDN